MLLDFSIKVPSGIDDTHSVILDKEAVSTCEYVEDIEICIDKMQAINEECISLTSGDLTTAEMLTYILNQCKKESVDSGNGTSLLDSSEIIGSQDKIKTLADYTKEIFGYFSENDESIISDCAGRQKESRLMPSCNNSHSLPDYYIEETSSDDILSHSVYHSHGNHHKNANKNSSNKMTIDSGVPLHQDVSGIDCTSNVYPYHCKVGTSHEQFQKDNFGYILESACQFSGESQKKKGK